MKINKFVKLLEENNFINMLFIIYFRMYKIFCGFILSTRVNIGSSPRVMGFGAIDGSKGFKIGNNFSCGKDYRLQAIYRHARYIYDPRVVIGNNVNINDYFHLACASDVQIGDNCLIASKVIITDHNHSVENCGISPIDRPLVCAPVKIENNVWIGENVVILPGITIGSGSIIGANSVVSNSIPKGCIAAGVPAKVLKIENS